MGAIHRLAVVALVAAALAVAVNFSAARDQGQWGDAPGHWRAWFASLMQPDAPTIPCCGESDAYWADSFEVDGDKYVAIITDTRPDEPLGRPHVPFGTRVVVPNHKIKYDKGNPTGHGIIFLNPNLYVFCYLAPGGV